ncbi:unnamed protein product [Periconia digitata]|uniref:DNA damage-inducible protein 1 n=1 Tax=Periconia digitata TaxID=1303443 RepID=A0A9W4UJQ3_9PLEO|nr:unnamed protein product [Periconia digitata]
MFLHLARPRVTISISAPDQPSESDILSMELPPGLTIEELKALIAHDTNHPVASQQLFLNGNPLNTQSQTLEEAGIQDGEMLALLVRRRGNPPQRQQQQPQPPQQPSRQGAADPEAVRQHVLRTPNAAEEIRTRRPALHAALDDPERWREEYSRMLRENDNNERERQLQIQRLNEDPFDIEAQRKIEEIIRQDRVIDNLQEALDNNPEVFGRVHMLYVNTEVNGVPVKAFVDSGAQATIMSPSCAERCGIMRLMDTRFAGMAKGVGTAKILGRVHSAEIQIGGAVMKCSFTVMEGKDVDLLFGLDMLKRYRAKIDLEKDALCFEGVEVPFLPENEIPKGFEDSEPTVEGPNGTKIGSISGAVKEGDSSSKIAQGPPETTPASASTPAPSTTRAASSTATQFPQKDIDVLVGLGFSRQDAVQALEAANGNVEYAASLLFAR